MRGIATQYRGQIFTVDVVGYYHIEWLFVAGSLDLAHRLRRESPADNAVHLGEMIGWSRRRPMARRWAQCRC